MAADRMSEVNPRWTGYGAGPGESFAVAAPNIFCNDTAFCSPTEDAANRCFFRSGPADTVGLKLQSAKGPVEVLIVDSVQKPSEN